MSTSLVFLVVLGIWAAYLVQQWMRRREHLGTAKSVDQFTEALRVLETRPPAAVTTPARPRAATVTPLRSQPGVVVKHAASATTPLAPAVRLQHARGRALALGGAALLFVATVLAAALGHAPWFLPVGGAVLVAGVVAYLAWSQSVRREATRRAVARPTAPVAPVVVHATIEPRTPVETVVERVAEPVETADVVAPAPARTPELFDVRVYDEPAPEPVVVVEEPLAPGTWRPTPVPAPLYTVKAQAPTPVAAPAPVVESDTVLSPVDIDDEVLDVEHFYPRVVNG